MNIHNSYFAIKNPLLIIEQWLNPCSQKATVDYKSAQLDICWTKRAARELSRRNHPLIVEMQIYFSCVVQKRVLFHESADYPLQNVNDKIQITLRPVQAESCDPVEYAKNHPVKHEYTTQAAKNFRPRRLELDFKNKTWQGQFSI